jgi:hypothetical protein
MISLVPLLLLLLRLPFLLQLLLFMLVHLLPLSVFFQLRCMLQTSRTSDPVVKEGLDDVERRLVVNAAWDRCFGEGFVDL